MLLHPRPAVPIPAGRPSLTKKMIEQFINFVIRPPRADYNPNQYLWEINFTLAGRTYKREDLELRNARGHTLQCSHYMPSPFPQDIALPCVIYCHGNSGCRADANEAAVILLPSNITVFTLDFSGSGLSDGDYVSLGWHEKDDLKVVISYLRSKKQVSRIGLWGRSMGAVTSLLYGAEDPSVAGMVLDSAFSNLFDLMMELVDIYKIRLPKFTVKMAVQYMRHVILKKAKFDIMGLNCLQAAPRTFIPALFGHATGDTFIQPHHSDGIFKSYSGDKNIIKFDGDHNSSRPKIFLDSVPIFFYNVLHPPQISSACLGNIEKYYEFRDLKLSAGIDESVLYEIITGLHTMGADVASSSSAPPSILAKKNSSRDFTDVAPLAIVDSASNQDNTVNSDEPLHLQDMHNDQNEGCCSYTSSNRESWGNCSSLGHSGEEDYINCTPTNNDPQICPMEFAMSDKGIQHKSLDSQKQEKKRSLMAPKKPRSEKFEKLEALTQRLCFGILKRVNHR